MGCDFNKNNTPDCKRKQYLWESGIFSLMQQCHF